MRFQGCSGRPNGSRLSCGRNARRRKAAERQTKRLGGEATQFFPTCERPAASSARSEERRVARGGRPWRAEESYHSSRYSEGLRFQLKRLMAGASERSEYE